MLSKRNETLGALQWLMQVGAAEAHLKELHIRVALPPRLKGEG